MRLWELGFANMTYCIILSNMEHTTHTRVLTDTNTYRREEKTVNGPGW